MADLDALYRGFRERYLDHDALEDQLRAWANALPDLVRLESIGRTPEGRDLWVLTLGPDPDRARPALWVDGNMHAVELCGSSVVLAFAEQILRLHLHGDTGDLPASLAPILSETLVYAMPRMSPDGAEAVLRTGRYVRSVPRDDRPQQRHPHWVAEDVDGDGRALLMRVEDPAGEFVESPEIPGLMVPRELGDPGPYYKLWPEGRIANFDGDHVPDPHFLSDNAPDLNRNFPWGWAPEPDQEGAGAFPTSEAESRAVVAFTSRRPHIFAWVNFHTFGGVFIRPLGHKPDNKMNPQDLALYRQLGAWAEALTGYPMVSGYEEFLYEPDRPLHGDLTDYAYNQRGAVAYVVELWDLFRRIGMPRPERFVEYYTRLERTHLHALARWDREHNRGRTLQPWVPVDHPQLGRVEVGGLDPRVGLWNPPYELLADVCARQVAMCLRLAALAPHVVTDVDVEPHGRGRHLVTLVVRNTGYLPTHVVGAARELPFNEPLYATVRTEGCRLADPSRAHVELGHLEGWGRGLHAGFGALYFQRSHGTGSTRVVRWLVEGDGRLEIDVGSCRVGTARIEVDLA